MDHRNDVLPGGGLEKSSHKTVGSRETILNFLYFTFVGRDVFGRTDLLFFI